ncbi:MAG: pilus assembly protein PilM, partial [Myxococcota bacterium]
MARILGIDIDGQDVRGVLARTSLRKVEVLQYAGARVEAPGPYPDGTPPGPDAEADALAAAVQQVLGQLVPAPELVVAALDGQEASLRAVELPIGVAKAKKIGETLPQQLDDLLPFDVIDAVVDHQPVDQDAATFRVLATAVPKDRVAARLAELASAGLDPKELAVGAAALDGLVHVVPELATAEIVLLVEVDATRTEVCVLDGGACTFARTLSGGAVDLDAGGPGAAQLTMSLRRSIGAYRASGRAPFVKAYVAGVGALGEGLAWIGDVVGVPAAPLPRPALPLPGASPEAPGLDPALAILETDGAGSLYVAPPEPRA